MTITARTLDKITGPLYKFVAREEWADAWCRGSFFINTLQSWREIEDAEQGDRDEAIHELTIDELRGNSGDLEFEKLRKFGLAINSSENGLVQDCTFVRSLRNAWGLSTTDHFNESIAANPKIGPYCVEVSDPMVFWRHLAFALNAFADSNPIECADIGYVRYADRKYSDIHLEPGPVGFVKPVVPYASQREVRMLWHPRNSTEIAARTVKVRRLARFCRRIR